MQRRHVQSRISSQANVGAADVKPGASRAAEDKTAPASRREADEFWQQSVGSIPSSGTN